MKETKLVSRILASVFICAMILFAAGTADATDIMTLDEVKALEPGTKGYGLTVYQGTLPSKFEFEVLGVDYLWMVATDTPVVLVKLTSGPEGFPPEKTGVVAGMSGSPMYIDGKLVGALAYGFGDLPKDAIAGIQPAALMLEPYSKTKKAKGKSAFAPIPLVLSAPATLVDLVNTLPRFKQDSFLSENFVITPALKTSGSSATAGAADNLKLEPGSSLNVYLVKGDINLAANGTVTMVDGDTIYAFGHPFFGLGDVEMSFHQAEVITTFSDYLDSYKMAGGAVGSAEGMITDDYYSAIKGDFRKHPKMIPVSISLNASGASYDVNFEVARVPLMVDKITDLVVFNVIYEGYPEVFDQPWGTPQKMTVKTKISLFDAPKAEFINFNDTYGFKYYKTFYYDDLLWAVDRYCGKLVSDNIAILEKKGALGQIKEIKINVEFAEDAAAAPETATITKITNQDSWVNPGEEVELGAVILASAGQNQKEFKASLPFTVPNDAVIGSGIKIVAGSGETLFDKQDVEGLSVEETVKYLNTFSSNDLFFRMEYQVDNPVEAEKSDETVVVKDLGSQVWQTSAMKTKKLFYKLPLPAGVTKVEGIEYTWLTVKKKEEVKDAKKEESKKSDSFTVFKVILSVFD